MSDKPDIPQFTLPTAGNGRYMCQVTIECYAEEGFETYEDILVWFPKRPYCGSRFTFRGMTWRLEDGAGRQWFAVVVDV